MVVFLQSVMSSSASRRFEALGGHSAKAGLLDSWPAAPQRVFWSAASSAEMSFTLAADSAERLLGPSAAKKALALAWRLVIDTY